MLTAKEQLNEMLAEAGRDFSVCVSGDSLQCTSHGSLTFWKTSLNTDFFCVLICHLSFKRQG